MAYMFRSFRMIIISLIPNLLPLLITAGLMGYLGVSIKPSTILVFRCLLQVVEGDSIVSPLKDDLVLELDGVLLLVNVDKLHQDHGDVDGHWYYGVVGLAQGGDGGHPPVGQH